IRISVQVQRDLLLQQPLKGALHDVTQEIGLINERLTQARRQSTILQLSHRSLRSRVVSTSHLGGAMAPYSHEKVAEPPNLQSLRGPIPEREWCTWRSFRTPVPATSLVSTFEPARQLNWLKPLWSRRCTPEPVFTSGTGSQTAISSVTATRALSSPASLTAGNSVSIASEAA